MDKKLKAKWVKALRSGKFKQARGHYEDGGAYCCLGVLACVATGRRLDDDSCDDWWSGKCGSRVFGDFDDSALIYRNDGEGGIKRPWSFNKIADYIEKKL